VDSYVSANTSYEVAVLNGIPSGTAVDSTPSKKYFLLIPAQERLSDVWCHALREPAIKEVRYTSTEIHGHIGVPSDGSTDRSLASSIERGQITPFGLDTYSGTY
jgi:hypothetical protein